MSGFDWADVIANIAGIADQELIDAGISIFSVQPLLGQNCQTPMLFPSRNPSINVQKVERLTFGQATNGGRRHKGMTAYTLDWIYLHIEYTQGMNPREYQTKIMQNMSAIFRSIVRRDRTLGSARVQPSSAEIDYNLQDPTSGKQFLGGHIVLMVDEIFEL